ncbi:MAG: luciferase family protein [Frankiales bacterium]|nr:luciferase family protein [Frankiales bacterium]
MAHGVEFGIYVPQVAFSWEGLLGRAQDVEELGFDALWLMDHLGAGPGMGDVPTFEGWTAATALLARTRTLRVGHLVLCNTFRHPVVLAKMVSTLDAISGGRFLFGLGSGSVEQEHLEAGLPWGPFAERTARLDEALTIIRDLLGGSDRTTFTGEHYQVRDVPNQPRPAGRLPFMLGGAGDRTLDLVARHADVWNCPTYFLDRLDDRLAALQAACDLHGRDRAEIRLSTQAVMVLVEREDQVADAVAAAERRYPGPMWGLHESGMVGTPDTVVRALQAHVDRGITTFTLFQHDRATRGTLELLAEQVVPRVGV